jgi:phosphoglycolate phosphatase-like HAD superfamily hydrolase
MIGDSETDANAAKAANTVIFRKWVYRKKYN